MEEILKNILTKLEKLDKMELDITAIKNDVKKIDKDVKQIDKKVDSISEVVAKTMEDVVGLKGQMEKQDIELKVLKGGK